MSLTSYRAAPPRVRVLGRDRKRRLHGGSEYRAPGEGSGGSPRGLQSGSRGGIRRIPPGFAIVKRLVLGRPGNDLLSRVLRHSTIGAEEFNGRVRDGIGFWAPRSNHRTGEGQGKCDRKGASSDWIRGPRSYKAQPSACANGQKS